MAVWPVGLPQKMKLAGQSVSPGDQTLRTATDAGEAKVRRRFSVVPAQIPVALDFTAAELVTFETFFNVTIKGGSDRFTWTHPSTGAAQDYRFVGPYRTAPLVPRTGPVAEKRHRITFMLETVTS